MRAIYIIGIFYVAALFLLWAGRLGRLGRRTAAALSLLCLAAGSGVLAAGVYPSGNVYGTVVTRLSGLPGGVGGPGKKYIALTFDDGPYPPYTGRLLDILKEKKVRATFFVVGEQAEKFPGLVKRMADEGHTVGLHAFRHRDFLKLAAEEKAEDLTQGKRVLRAITGKEPAYWRPPHGFRDPEAMETAAAQGLQAVNWSVVPRDWTGIGRQEIVNRVMNDAENGAIVLLHDGDSPFYRASRQAVVDAAGPLIDSLREKGYHLVSLEEYAGK